MATKKRKMRTEPLLTKQEEEEDQTEYEPTEEPQPQTHETADDDQDEPSGAPDVDPDEDIADLLEPLSRDQLISLLRAAAALDPRTLAEIRRAADRDPAHRKIFVHGLNWTTTADALRSFFSQYGEIEECKLVTDRTTGKSKGYGFILFRTRRASRLALREPQKSIDGRMTACQLASVGPVSTTPSHAPPPQPAAPAAQPSSYHTPQDVLPRKIFVGNVHADVNKDRLYQFFSQFGEIEEGPLGFDRQTGKAKGFALFIYRTIEGARRALQDPNKNFEGKLLYCQKATDSQKGKGGPLPGGAAPQQSVASEAPGSVGFNVGPVGFPGGMDLGFAQGLLGAALPFAQGIQANPAALAMLAAAGQNPAAFGMPPAMMASLNPALAAAAMNPAAGGGPVVPPPGQGPQVQGYGIGPGSGFPGVSFQGQPGQQSSGSFPNAAMAHNSTLRPGPGSIGGFGPH